jgi:hypothetical protein
VQHHVHGQRPAQLLDQAHGLDLAVEGPGSGDPVGPGRLVGLDADLDVVEAGGPQLLGSRA